MSARRLLIVSPHFPPSSTADMHRVRLVIPFLEENGWIPEVLAVSHESTAAPLDQWLAEGISDAVPIHVAPALGKAWGTIPGLGTLGFRSLPALARMGDRILAQRRFDGVYFSSTVFPSFMLGPRWRKKFGVRYVIDYQDPWVNDYYQANRDAVRPGGTLKFLAADSIDRRMEPHVLRQCSGITSVSPEYPRQLARRYPWFANVPFLVEPFPAGEADFERIPEGVPPLDGCADSVNWVYVGRGGADMTKAVRSLFLAIRDFGSDDLKRRLRLHFIGTSYAPAGEGRKTLEHLARETGAGIDVHESTDRVPYSDSLRLLKYADAVLVPGSDDPSYTASKIYPYLLARKPMLAIFHAGSSVVELLNTVGGSVCVSFESEDTPEAIANRIGLAWFANGQHSAAVELDRPAFEPFTARASATRLAKFFDETLRSVRRDG